VCVDWMSGQPFDRDEAEAFGLRAGDAMNGEISPRESNAICRTRLMDICQLASFHRPLVLSFDQTEVYGHHPALARAFGLIVATPTSQVGVRRFLQLCQQRWENAPTREITLREHYDRQCADILRSPKRLVFNPDALQWLIEVAACGLANVQVVSLEERYFSV